MSPTAAKISQIEKRSLNYRVSGGQGRIILIAGIDPLGPAFDFVIDLSQQTKSLIEVLYIRPADGDKSTLNALLDRLAHLGCDFQMTYLTGNLLEKLSDFSPQRQDIMAVVCSASEGFTEELKSASQTLDPAIRNCLPAVLLIGNSFVA